MTIVVTGGGSGGHITPILAVAAELKKLDKSVRIVYIGQTGDHLSDIPAADPNIDEVFTVRAGKFRRYHGEGWRQLLDIPTQLKNIRDIVWIVTGLVQSFLLMRRLKPQIIFSRGGFVSVPVALGGSLNGVPYITHDSDSVPSLANRIIARWASMHAVALPAEVYPYPPAKIRVVGVPVSHNYERVDDKLTKHYKKLLQIDGYDQVLLVTGGGNGAQNLNMQVVANAAYLLKRYPKLVILHVAGRALVSETKTAYDQALSSADRKRVIVEGFVSDMYRYSGAATVIIARGGATNLAEFAIQAKPTIVVPAEFLVGGHQMKNAKAFVRRQAIELLTEEQAAQERRLGTVVADLLDHPEKQQQLASNLHKLAHQGSARELAELLLQSGKAEV